MDILHRWRALAAALPLVRPRSRRRRHGPAPAVLPAVVPAARLRAPRAVKGTRCRPMPVVLSADEAAELSDRVYQVRCAAEDVATAVDEGADAPELRDLCDALMRAAKAADGWR